MAIDPITKPSGDPQIYMRRDPIGVERYDPITSYKPRGTNDASRWLAGVRKYVELEHSLDPRWRGLHDTLKIPHARCLVVPRGDGWYDVERSQSMVDGEVDHFAFNAQLAVYQGHLVCMVQFAGYDPQRVTISRMFGVVMHPRAHVVAKTSGVPGPRFYVFYRTRDGDVTRDTAFWFYVYRRP